MSWRNVSPTRTVEPIGRVLSHLSVRESCGNVISRMRRFPADVSGAKDYRQRYRDSFYRAGYRLLEPKRTMGLEPTTPGLGSSAAAFPGVPVCPQRSLLGPLPAARRSPPVPPLPASPFHIRSSSPDFCASGAARPAICRLVSTCTSAAPKARSASSVRVRRCDTREDEGNRDAGGDRERLARRPRGFRLSTG
jgi:hypothetical protein